MEIELTVEELESVIEGILEDGIECSFDESSLDSIVTEGSDEFLNEFDNRVLGILEERLYGELVSRMEKEKENQK